MFMSGSKYNGPCSIVLRGRVESQQQKLEEMKP